MGVICNLPKLKKEKRERPIWAACCWRWKRTIGGGGLSLSLKFSYNKLWSVVVTGLWGYKIVREMCGEKLTSTA